MTMWTVGADQLSSSVHLLSVPFQGRVCMKRCDSDADCRSRNRKCVCDGVCGMSCIKQGEYFDGSGSVTFVDL